MCDLCTYLNVFCLYKIDDDDDDDGDNKCKTVSTVVDADFLRIQQQTCLRSQGCTMTTTVASSIGPDALHTRDVHSARTSSQMQDCEVYTEIRIV